jgi:ferrous iron transport protein B
MTLMFVCIFWVAQVPMDAIDNLTAALGKLVKAKVPEGDLQSLLSDGVIKGVGGVVIFLPQILILFFFLGLLEDTGYMARAAFIMDRLMSKVGLHGNPSSRC